VSVKSTLRQQGYATIVGEDSKLIEMDTYTCAHCNSVHHLHDRMGNKKDPGGFCMLCFKQICGLCADTGKCDPFEKKLLRMEAGEQFRRVIG